MPIRYICRKCGKDHSKEEYAQSMFCKACGSLLLKTFQKGTPIPTAQTVTTSRAPEEKFALIRAAENLRQRIGRSREYEIVTETEEEQPKEPVAGYWIWNSEYDEAIKLEKNLTKQYKGKNLEETIPGKSLSNEQGECYAISASCASTFKKAAYQESRRLIISDLKILPGIGPTREQNLKRQGYSTIEDLENHLLWRKQARNFMKILDDKEVGSTQKWLWQRLPKSHPLLHYLAGLCQDQDFAIIDIETLGLSERPIILLGIAKPAKDHIYTSQFLLRNIPDEPSAIWALVSQINPKAALITYNGKGFDIPYIRQRLAYYGLDAQLDNPQFDLLHFTRRALRNKLTNCKLETVEKHIGIKRDIDIPGALVPHFYDTYLRTKNVGPLVAIVEHNKQDLLTLGTLFSKLYEEWRL